MAEKCEFFMYSVCSGSTRRKKSIILFIEGHKKEMAVLSHGLSTGSTTVRGTGQMISLRTSDQFSEKEIHEYFARFI